MDREAHQGRWLIERGVLPRALVEDGLRELAALRGQGRGEPDLCALLVSRGLLNAAAAAEARRAAGRARSTPGEAWALAPGAVLDGAYLVEGELSRGGMGVVLKGRRLRGPSDGPDEPVAIKFLLNADFTADDLLRFEREMRVLIRLKHRNIVEIKDLGAVGGRPYLAMELIDGIELKAAVDFHWKAGAPPPWRESVERVLAVARALEYCHARGVVHRDVKPQNILIERGTGRAVLADFGLIRREGVGATRSLTASGVILGTPAFMAPEQFSPGGDFGELGPPADVWSLAATLFYCLTGRPPYPQGNPVSIVQAMLAAAPPSASSLNPEVPLWIDALLTACFQRDADRRPTIGAVVARLEQGGAPSPRRARWRLSAALALLVLTGLAAFFLAPRGREPGRADSEQPKLTLSVEGLAGDGLVTVSSGSPILAVRVESSGASRVRLRDGAGGLIEAQSLVGSRRAVFVLPDVRRPVPYTVEVESRFGQERRSLFYCGPGIGSAVERARSEERYRLLLGRSAGLDAWRAFSDDELQELALAVWLRRRERLDFLGIERAPDDRGERGYRTPRFRHRASGAILHLIPGGRVWSHGYAMVRTAFHVAEQSDDDEFLQILDYLGTRGFFGPDIVKQVHRAMPDRAADEPFETIKDLTDYVRRAPAQRLGYLRLLCRGLGLMFDESEPGPRVMIKRSFLLDGRMVEVVVPRPQKAWVEVPPLLIADTELTRQQWQAMVGEGAVDKTSGEPLGSLPMTGLGYAEAVEALSREGLRLPRHAEWRHAASARASPTRAGERPEPPSERYFKIRAWHAASGVSAPQSVRTHRKYPNLFGLSDVLGNALEMTESTTLPNLFEERYSALMGGDWLTPGNLLEVDFFVWQDVVGLEEGVIGLRPVMDPPNPGEP